MPLQICEGYIITLDFSHTHETHVNIICITYVMIRLNN